MNPEDIAAQIPHPIRDMEEHIDDQAATIRDLREKLAGADGRIAELEGWLIEGRAISAWNQERCDYAIPRCGLSAILYFPNWNRLSERCRKEKIEAAKKSLVSEGKLSEEARK